MQDAAQTVVQEPREEDNPTVLLVGTGDRMQEALAAALERRGVFVEMSVASAGVEASLAAAPDLVLLVGDAAADGGQAIVRGLVLDPATATVPVALLADDASLGRRLEAFRHGVVAVVERSASADGMAREVAAVLRGLPDRAGSSEGLLCAASIEEIVELFSQQLRSGILSITREEGGAVVEGANVVLRAGRPVTEAIKEVIDQIRPLVDRAGGGLHYEFHERPASRVGLLDLAAAIGEEADAAFRELRVLLVANNPADADAIVQELRAREAQVSVVDGAGKGLARARVSDPEVIIVDRGGATGWAREALQRVQRDRRLRWASLLVVDMWELWPEGSPAPQIERLAAGIAPLVKPDRDLTERARAERPFDARLETIGPSRTLRALAAADADLKVTVRHARALADVDLTEGLVVGAVGTRPEDPARRLEGPAALAAFMLMSSGRIHVEKRTATTLGNMMSPVEDALAAAEAELPPQPAVAVPPPAPTSAKAVSAPPAAETEPAGEQATRLITQLEDVLSTLKQVLPRTGEILAPQRLVSTPPPAPALEPEPEPLESSPTRKVKWSAIAPLLGAGNAPRPPAEAPRSAAGEARPEWESDWDSGWETDLDSAHRDGRGSADEAPRRPDVEEPVPDVEEGVQTIPILDPRDLPLSLAAHGEHEGLEAEGDPARPVPTATATPLAAAAAGALDVDEPEDDDEEDTLVRRDLDTDTVVDEVPPLPLVEGIRPAAAEVKPQPVASGSPPSHAASGAHHELPRPEEWGPPASRDAAGLVPTLAEPVEGEPDLGAPALEARRSSRGLRIAVVLVGLLLLVAVASFVATLVVLSGESSTPSPVMGISTAAVAADASSGPVPVTPAGPTPAPARGAQGAPDAAETEAGVTVIPLIDAPAAMAEDADGGPASADPVVVQESVSALLLGAARKRQAGDMAAAESRYLRALKLQPSSSRAVVGLIQTHLQRGDSRSAVFWAKKLVKMRPGRSASYLLLGDALERSGDGAGARSAWEKGLKVAPGDGALRRRLKRL